MQLKKAALAMSLFFLSALSSAAGIDSALLKATNFNEFRLSEFVTKDTKALVVIFAGTHCPLIRQYVPTMEKLRKDFEARGVVFLLVYSDKNVTAFSMAQHALEYDIPFRTLVDQESKLAKALGAKTLSETVVLDPSMKEVYRGMIDDQYRVAGRLPAPRNTYLRDALESVLTNQEVKVKSTVPSGCSIEYYNAEEKPEVKTYYEDVAPIIQNKCQICHRPGGPGSVFDVFMNYEDVSNHAETIRQVVTDGRMPPSYTVMNGHFGTMKNDRRLSAEEIATIDAWVRNGSKAGDAKKGPQPKVWPKQDWVIGKPDLVLSMAKPFSVPATGIIDYQFFKLKLNYAQDQWVQAVEIQPGNAKVVHHAELHIVKSDNEDYSGTAGMTKVYGFTGDKAYMLSGYVPGDDDDNARVFPAGQGMRIPKGHDLVLEIHYTTSGKVETDRTRVGMIWSKQVPKVELCTHTFRFPRAKLNVAPFDARSKAQKDIWFRKDVMIHSWRAHMHKIGQSWKLEMVSGDKKEFLMGVPTWDFNWQRSFDMAEPMFVPAGQNILMTGYWDNSKQNPFNSDPHRAKEWGLQTEDEMLNTRVKFSIVNKGGKQAQCAEALP